MTIAELKKLYASYKFTLEMPRLTTHRPLYHLNPASGKVLPAVAEYDPTARLLSVHEADDDRELLPCHGLLVQWALHPEMPRSNLLDCIALLLPDLITIHKGHSIVWDGELSAFAGLFAEPARTAIVRVHDTIAQCTRESCTAPANL